jgi:hypothetical protein
MEQHGGEAPFEGLPSQMAPKQGYYWIRPNDPTKGPVLAYYYGSEGVQPAPHLQDQCLVIEPTGEAAQLVPMAMVIAHALDIEGPLLPPDRMR